MFHTEGRTDRHTYIQTYTEGAKLIVASHNSANALKNEKNSKRRTGRYETKEIIKETEYAKLI